MQSKQQRAATFFIFFVFFVFDVSSVTIKQLSFHRQSNHRIYGEAPEITAEVEELMPSGITEVKQVKHVISVYIRKSIWIVRLDSLQFACLVN